MYEIVKTSTIWRTEPEDGFEIKCWWSETIMAVERPWKFQFLF